MIPTDAPDEIKEFIRECWAENPDQRPHFDQILTKLESMNCVWEKRKVRRSLNS